MRKNQVRKIGSSGDRAKWTAGLSAFGVQVSASSDLVRSKGKVNSRKPTADRQVPRFHFTRSPDDQIARGPDHPIPPHFVYLL